MSARTVVVIGGGPGGYSAALKAASLGCDVRLIERDQVGGTCVNRGCIPTKTWLKSAEVARLLNSSSRYGVRASEILLDPSSIKARVESAVSSIRSFMMEALSRAGVDVVRGEGIIRAPGEVWVRGSDRGIRCDCIIIAAGSSPRFPDVPGLSGERVISGEEALFLDEFPSRAVVLGGGAIGLEVSTLLASLGSAVSLVEVKPRLLPEFDEDLSSAAGAGMESLGIKVFAGESVKEVIRRGSSMAAVLSGGSSVEADLIVVAAGRKPNSVPGLEKLGIRPDVSGAIPVHPAPKTSAPHVFAVGDVTGRHFLAHAAMAEGEAAGSLAAGVDARHDDRFVPKCVHSFPGISSVGLTESKARSLGYDVVVGVSPFSLNALSLCHDDHEGFVKVVSERRYGEILGVHVAGPHAPDLIADAVTAMTLESTLVEWASAIRPHPAYSETMSAAISAALDGIKGWG